MFIIFIDDFHRQSLQLFLEFSTLSFLRTSQSETPIVSLFAIFFNLSLISLKVNSIILENSGKIEIHWCWFSFFSWIDYWIYFLLIFWVWFWRRVRNRIRWLGPVGIASRRGVESKKNGVRAEEFIISNKKITCKRKLFFILPNSWRENIFHKKYFSKKIIFFLSNRP